MLGYCARRGYRQDEVALPVHSGRHPRLGCAGVAGPGGHALRGPARKCCCTQIATVFSMFSIASTGEYLSASKLVDKLDWATGIDKKGRPILVPGKDPTPVGNRVCPGVRGATNWMSPSFNPETSSYMWSHWSSATSLRVLQNARNRRRTSPGGGAAPNRVDLGQFFLRAYDPQTGKRVWEYPMTGPAESWAGTVSTAGGVIFFGDDEGHLVAVDAKRGRHLWHYQMGRASQRRLLLTRLTASSMSRLHLRRRFFRSVCSRLFRACLCCGQALRGNRLCALAFCTC